MDIEKLIQNKSVSRNINIINDAISYYWNKDDISNGFFKVDLNFSDYSADRNSSFIFALFKNSDLNYPVLIKTFKISNNGTYNLDINIDSIIPDEIEPDVYDIYIADDLENVLEIPNIIKFEKLPRVLNLPNLQDPMINKPLVVEIIQSEFFGTSLLISETGNKFYNKKNEDITNKIRTNNFYFDNDNDLLNISFEVLENLPINEYFIELKTTDPRLLLTLKPIPVFNVVISTGFLKFSYSPLNKFYENEPIKAILNIDTNLYDSGFLIDFYIKDTSDQIFDKKTLYTNKPYIINYDFNKILPKGRYYFYIEYGNFNDRLYFSVLPKKDYNSEDIYLSKYTPPYFNNLLEVKDFQKVVYKEIKLLNDKIQNIINEQYINTAENYGLVYLELFLGIPVNIDNNLYIRRQIIENRLRLNKNFTLDYLIENLNFLLGENNYNIDYEKLTENKLIINIILMNTILIDEFKSIINIMKPAVVTVEISELLSSKVIISAGLKTESATKYMTIGTVLKEPFATFEED